VNFDETLSTLLRWMGTPVDVVIQTPGAILAGFSGELRRAPDTYEGLRERFASWADKPESLMFEVGPLGQAQFYLDSDQFEQADWRDLDREELAIQIGDATLLVQPQRGHDS
jgi:hypothetical protein